ncbi:hypothetical protein LTR37_008998 [Vermiconidia calcicola]|uniref:Uncharacterized protein n=1 Tax=Vermiconidia calcicola TaxID=1690605 RepID=A0ACC3N9B5_9PEZI|nr:hypothetical protein LTR37_008998 [Vermiconidia calcicola]
MEQANTNPSQPRQATSLDFITLDIVRTSRLDDDTKSFFTLELDKIQTKLVPIDWSTPEALSLFDNWLALSEVFYEEAGIACRENKKEKIDFGPVFEELYNKMIEIGGDGQDK